MRTTLTILTMAAALTAARAQDTDLLARAKQYYESDDFPQAIALLDKLIETETGNAEAWVLKGNCYQKEEKYVAAVQAYEEAETKDPQWALPQAYHGSALINLKQYDLAEKKVKNALKSDPTLPEGHYYMGNLAYFGYKPAAAVRHYNRAIKLRPEYLNALYMRAAAHAELEEYRKALADYEHVLAIDPSLTAARFNAAVIRLRDNQYDKAAELLDGINPEELPDPKDFYFYRGEALYFAGKKAEACEVYAKAKDMGDVEAAEIYRKYCVDKEKRKEEPKTRTIRMAF